MRQRGRLPAQAPAERLQGLGGALHLDRRAGRVVDDVPAQSQRAGQTIHERAKTHPLHLTGHVEAFAFESGFEHRTEALSCPIIVAAPAKSPAGSGCGRKRFDMSAPPR